MPTQLHVVFFETKLASVTSLPPSTMTAGDKPTKAESHKTPCPRNRVKVSRGWTPQIPTADATCYHRLRLGEEGRLGVIRCGGRQ